MGRSAVGRVLLDVAGGDVRNARDSIADEGGVQVLPLLAIQLDYALGQGTCAAIGQKSLKSPP